MISRSTVVAKLPADSANRSRSTSPEYSCSRSRTRMRSARRSAFMRFGVNHGQRLRELRGDRIFEREHLAPRQRLARPASGAVGCMSSAAQRCSSSASTASTANTLPRPSRLATSPVEQPVPGAARHALRQDGIEDEAARRRQHETGIVAATAPRSLRPPSASRCAACSTCSRLPASRPKRCVAEIVRARRPWRVRCTRSRELRRVAGEAAHDDHEAISLERSARQLALVRGGARAPRNPRPSSR